MSHNKTLSVGLTEELFLAVAEVAAVVMVVAEHHA
jgi:hypothetical protein